MKKSTFEIAVRDTLYRTVRDNEKVVRHGYVYGAFSIWKNPVTYRWDVTHLKTGLAVYIFGGKNLPYMKKLITTMNDRYNWDGNDQHEIAKLNGMSLPDFYTELKRIISEIKPTQQEKHT